MKSVQIRSFFIAFTFTYGYYKEENALSSKTQALE